MPAENLRELKQAWQQLVKAGRWQGGGGMRHLPPVWVVALSLPP